MSPLFYAVGASGLSLKLRLNTIRDNIAHMNSRRTLRSPHELSLC